MLTFILFKPKGTFFFTHEFKHFDKPQEPNLTSNPNRNRIVVHRSYVTARKWAKNSLLLSFVFPVISLSSLVSDLISFSTWTSLLVFPE